MHMDRLPYATAPRWWSARLSRFWMRVIRPPRRIRERFRERLVGVEVRGLDHIREVLNRNEGALIVTNHAGHLDAFIFLRAGEKLRRPFLYMVAWQTLYLLGAVGRWVLRRHGCFS